MKTIDMDVRAVSAFNGWCDLLSNLERGYVPTLYPETDTHKRVRRAVRKAGYRVFPERPVKVTGLTAYQMDDVENYLECSSSSNDRITRHHAAKAVVTRTTVTMSRALAEEFITWIGCWKDDRIDSIIAETDNQWRFAADAIRRSVKSLQNKFRKALNNVR